VLRVETSCGAGSQVDARYEQWNASYGSDSLSTIAINWTNQSRPDRCQACPVSGYKHLSDNSACVACVNRSSTRLPGAFLLSQVSVCVSVCAREKEM
jgi:hypothetical protein